MPWNNAEDYASFNSNFANGAGAVDNIEVGRKAESDELH